MESTDWLRGRFRSRQVQTVSLATHGEEVGRVCGVGFDLAAKHGDEVVDGAGAGIGVVAPDDVEEHLA